MGIYLQLLGEVGRSLATEPRTLAHAPPGKCLPPCRKNCRVQFTRKWQAKSPGEEFNTRYWGPISKDSAVAKRFWSVFSSSLPSALEGLDFPLLPSSWKSLELKTCLLELVQPNNLFQDEIWKGKMQYVELGSPCEEAKELLYLPPNIMTSSLPVFSHLSVFICEQRQGRVCDGVIPRSSEQLGLLFPSPISFPPLPPDGISSQESVSRLGLVSHFHGVTGLLCLLCHGKLWY